MDFRKPVFGLAVQLCHSVLLGRCSCLFLRTVVSRTSFRGKAIAGYDSDTTDSNSSRRARCMAPRYSLGSQIHAKGTESARESTIYSTSLFLEPRRCEKGRYKIVRRMQGSSSASFQWRTDSSFIVDRRRVRVMRSVPGHDQSKRLLPVRQ